jgi:hypothetical protein
MASMRQRAAGRGQDRVSGWAKGVVPAARRLPRGRRLLLSRAPSRRCWPNSLVVSGPTAQQKRIRGRVAGDRAAWDRRQALVVHGRNVRAAHGRDGSVTVQPCRGMALR